MSLFPAVLSSGVMVSANPTILQGSLALITSLAYLLHIRVIDEYRDFGHDNVHHTTRPVQSGIISKRELLYVDSTAVLLLVGIAAIAGSWALVMVAVMLAYSYLAGKEFFIGEDIRRHFFIYNGVNLVQMLLMQVFVYTIFADPFPFTTLVWLHFLFTTVGTIIFEFARKLKMPGDDGTGKDTYTWYLGFNNSLLIYSLFLSLNAMLFFWITTLITPHTMYALIFTVGLVATSYLTVLLHWVKKTRETDQLMQLSFLLLYGIFNIAIYFLTVN
ncbi:MAG: hypothetical protein Q8R55_03235 [Candidatus Taylorbacteria bacterium]|nr:hypothetical protein [Candidatus Taylorbacteria bacterium]